MFRQSSVWSLLLSAILLLLAGMASAAPYHGNAFTYQQPDGESFRVRLWGDEFFAYQETEDGYLIARDEKTGEFCYAKVAGNGDIVSTGVRVGLAKPPGLKPKQRLTPAQAMEKSRPRREAAGVDDNGQLKPELRGRFFPKKGKAEKSGTQDTPTPDGGATLNAPDGTGSTQSAPAEESETPPIAYAPGDPPAIDKRVGLLLLASFPDKPQDVTRTMADIDAFCNAPSSVGNGVATSVYGYYQIQSNGRVEYKNVVTAWFTAKKPQSYYADNSVEASVRSKELIKEGLDFLQSNGFDFTQCDADGNNVIDGVNCMYAGARTSAWSFGLWPHQRNDTWSGFASQGLSTSYQYQITDMPATLPLGTFCHENGHMLFNFPDLYPYNTGAANMGGFSLMSSYNEAHPRALDAYLKISTGWASVVDLDSSSSQRCVVQRDLNHFYRYRNPARTSESFIFEVRHNSGYEGVFGGASACNPASGLVAYHALDGGSNTDSSIVTTASPVNYGTPYKLMVIEANPSTSAVPWYIDPTPGSNDAFTATDKSEISDSTSPALKFWSSTGRTVASLADVRAISVAGETMSFTIGSGEITAPASIGVTSSGIAAITSQGVDAASQSFSVFNQGAGSLTYTASANVPWLSVSPGSGAVSTAADVLTVTFSNTASVLTQGIHTASITLSSPEASNSPVTIPVTLKVDGQWTVPVITSQPVGTHLLGDAGYTLTATATGYPAPQFQWYRNGVPVLGVMGGSYTISSATASDAGTYTVQAFNLAGTATSDPAVVTVNDHPVITRITPVKDYATIPENHGLVLQVAATDDGYGGSSLTRSWSVQSAPAGGTVTWDNTDTTDTAATFSVNGDYQLRFTSTDGVNTRFVDYFVSIGATPGWLGTTDHIVQYDFTETSGTTAVDAAGGNQNGTLVGGAAFSNGKLALDGSTGYLSIPSVPEIDTAGPYAKRSVSFWFKANAMSKDQMLYEEGGAVAGMNIYLTSGKYLIFNLWNQNAASTVSSYATAGYYLGAGDQSGKWRHLALVLDATPGGTTVQSGALRMYLNGTLIQSKNGVRLDSHADGIGIGGINGTTRDGIKNVISSNYFFNGEIKDFRLYNRALSAAEIATVIDMSNLGPVVDAGPDLSGNVGLPVTLHGTAIDEGLPDPPSLATSWSVVSGPGSGTFDHAASLDTYFTGNAAGSYVLRLAANDGNITTFDQTTFSNSIASGPGMIVFATSSQSVAETAGTLQLTVNRPLGAGINGTVSVSYAAVNGTAVNGSDFTLAPGTLSWADQESGPKTIDVTIINDALQEYDESFSVVLGNPTGGAVLANPSTATVTIPANDAVAPWFAWDAALDTTNDNLWPSATANAYTWTFDAGNKATVAVNGSRLTTLTKSHAFPGARDQSNTSWTGYGSNSPATFEFIIDVDADNGVIFETGGTTNAIALDLSGGILRGTVSPSVQVTHALTTGEKSDFIHVVLVLDQVNNVLQLFVDGVLKNTKAWTTSESWSGTGGCGLGGTNSTLPTGLSDTGDFTGKMALFRFYKAALTAQQIDFVYQTFEPNSPPAWNANPIAGTTAAEGVSYSATLAGNASDPDGNPLTFSKISGPAWLNVASNGALSGTPANSDVGSSSFMVSVSDGSAAAVQAALNITVQTAFAAWANQSTTFTQDVNLDGLADGLAWLLGAGSPSENARGLLPQATVDSGNLVASFKVLNAANRGSALLRLQYSKDLGAGDLWTNHTVAVPDFSGMVGGVDFVITPIGGGNLNQVQATIPSSAAGSDGRIFIRLRGEDASP